jgi:hypothetical protein
MLAARAREIVAADAFFAQHLPRCALFTTGRSAMHRLAFWLAVTVALGCDDPTATSSDGSSGSGANGAQATSGAGAGQSSGGASSSSMATGGGPRLTGCDDCPLGQLAQSMPAGSWAELATSGLDAAIGDNGSSGHILTYSYEMEWDPTTEQIFFVGGDHNGCEKFVSYSAASNSWTIEPTPSWLPSCPSQNHSYNYHALDPVNGRYFYQDGNNNLWRYDIGSQSWDLSFSLPLVPYY